jgi:hypothetical protein
MEDKKREISLVFYYVLIAGFTNLVFLAVGILVSILLKLSETLIIIVLIILLVKSGVVGFVTWALHRQSRINREFAVKFIGMYFGRFYGLIAGAILGAEIAKGIGAIVGALLFYYIGRWLGSKISISISKQIENVFALQEKQVGAAVKATHSKKYFSTLYIVFFPLFFVFIAYLFNYYGIQINYPVGWLPIARAIAIVLSIFSIFYPWIMRRQWKAKILSNEVSPGFDVFWIGLTLSVVPVIYGFVLFFLGASILELCFFAIASSGAAILWWTRIKSQKVAA